MCGQYVRFADTFRPTELPTPLLGEHNVAILNEAGLDEEAIEQLYRDKLIRTEAPA